MSPGDPHIEPLRQLRAFITTLEDETKWAEIADGDPGGGRLRRILSEVRGFAWEVAGVNLEEV